MSGAVYPQLVQHSAWGEWSVRSWRVRERLLVGVAVLVPLVLALAISVEMPKPSVSNVLLVVGLIAGVAGALALMVSPRYTVTLTLLALYLGLLDGPVKLESPGRVTSGARDVLIIAIVLGMLMRVGAGSERIRLPPLFAWVMAFAAVVLIEALNPHTNGILKSVGGYRQQLEWVPFFFFGYLLVNSKQRFRQLFLVLGVIALANGVVGAYQSQISPSQLASWGPGYDTVVNGGAIGTGRTYVSGGVVRARPPALGSDAGFGGGIGVVALPGLLALLAAGRLRRRWPIALCCVGALLGIATSASRTATVAAVLSLVVFALLSLVARLRGGRSLAVLAAIGVMTLAVGAALVASDGSGVFARQETLTSVQTAQEHGAAAKEHSLSQIPSYLIHAPFGFGLGTSGAASGFGGHQRIEVEGQKVIGGSAYSLLMKELGAPGLLIWIGFSLAAIALGVSLLRRVRDSELRTYLVAVLTSFIALAVMGLSGPTLAVTVGAFLWFAPGVLAYWSADARRAAMKPAPVAAP